MNVTKLKLTCRTAAAALLVLAAPRAHAGTSTSFALKLDKLLKSYNVTADQVISAQAFATSGLEAKYNWERGIFGTDAPLKDGAVGVTGAGGPMPVDAALRLVPGLPGLEPVHAYKCHGGVCEALAVDADSQSQVSVQFGHSKLTVNIYGDFCLPAKGECALLMPSWAIAKVLASRDNSLAMYPKIAVLVQLPGRLLLVDAATGHTWLRWAFASDSPLASIGVLKATTFSANGRLIAQFSKGGLLLDFAQDLAALADANANIYLKSDGLGSGRLDNFVMALDSNTLGWSSHNGSFLALGDGYAVSSTGALSFNLKTNGGVIKLASADGGNGWRQAQWLPLATASEPALAALRIASDGSSQLEYLDQNKGLDDKVAASYASFPDATVLPILMGSDVFGSSSSTWVAPLVSGADAKTLGIISGRSAIGEALAPAAEELLEARAKDAGQTGTDAICEWTRVALTHDGRARESGHAEAACGAKIGFGVANTGGVMSFTAISGNDLLVQIWWPDQGN